MKIPILLFKRPSAPPSVCADRCWTATTSLPFPQSDGLYGQNVKFEAVVAIGTTADEAKTRLVQRVAEIAREYRIVRQDEIEVPTFEVEAKLY